MKRYTVKHVVKLENKAEYLSKLGKQRLDDQLFFPLALLFNMGIAISSLYFSGENQTIAPLIIGGTAQLLGGGAYGYFNLTSKRLENLRTTVSAGLETIRKDNNEKLELMRRTVDEKLEKTLETKMTESFRLVSERLEQVYKGLGEMQTLASGVGDLKKVLSNVKTRGILGEIQLGAILEDILPRDRYEENFATVSGSSAVVEFAIKLPGDGEKPVYLPVDSKFPADCYFNLQSAYDEGDAEAIKKARAELISRMKSFAKDIRTKYISPPDTTDFAIMFLPFEGLYAEAVRCGMVEILQKDYHINIAGPGTMAALLNSLQMGFKTLAIQKRSAEVWKILGAVKTEFDKFSDILEKTRKKLGQIDTELDTLIGTRTAAIKRKLRDVESISDGESAQLLDE